MDTQDKITRAEKYFQEYRDLVQQEEKINQDLENLRHQLRAVQDNRGQMQTVIENYISTGEDIMTCVFNTQREIKNKISALGLSGNWITTTADIGMGTIDIAGQNKPPGIFKGY